MGHFGMVHWSVMKRSVFLSSVALFAVIGLAVFAYMHWAGFAVFNPHGSVGASERSVIEITLLLCGVVVIPVFGMLFYFAWRFRDKGTEATHKHEPNWDHESLTAEIVWWVVPSIIIIALSVVAWQSSYALDPYKPLSGDADTLTIDVVALDWKWLFIYPTEGIATVNMVEFPVGAKIHFNLTADAPMNSFWIPSLGGQLMVMPGMSNQLNLEANTEGVYSGYSANLSGKGFAGMTFDAHAVSQSEFDSWVASARVLQHPLDVATYTALAQPSEYAPVETFSPADPNLYTLILKKYMTPGGMNMKGSGAVTSATIPTSSASPGMKKMPDNMPGMQMGDIHTP